MALKGISPQSIADHYLEAIYDTLIEIRDEMRAAGSSRPSAQPDDVEVVREPATVRPKKGASK